MPEWAERVITWDEAAEYIAGGTVESLGKLRRSEQQLATYRAAMDKVCCVLRGTAPGWQAVHRRETGAAKHTADCLRHLQVRQDYASVGDYVKIAVLERTSRVNAGARDM
jgi:hypothetical protein